MDPNGRAARLVLLMERQAGAFTRAQALRLGYSRSAIDRRLRSGTWVALHPGVFVVPGAPVTRMTELWAAVLAAGEGTSVTHETSATIHGAERLAAEPITLTNRHGSHHRIDGAFVHQIDDLTQLDLVTWRGLSLSSPARSIVEIAATSHRDLVDRALDDLVRSKRTSFGAIAAALGRVARPGKPGVTTLARLLDARTGGHVPSQSELERAMFSGLEAGGLPAPVRQLPLPGRGPILGIADGGYRDAMVVLEADGRRWHTRMEASRRDRERDAQVVRAGWVPLRFVYEQIVEDPAGMCESVWETRETRLRQLRRSA